MDFCRRLKCNDWYLLYTHEHLFTLLSAFPKGSKMDTLDGAGSRSGLGIVGYSSRLGPLLALTMVLSLFYSELECQFRVYYVNGIFQAASQ